MERREMVEILGALGNMGVGAEGTSTSDTETLTI
jgi:hypothetical protein